MKSILSVCVVGMVSVLVGCAAQEAVIRAEADKKNPEVQVEAQDAKAASPKAKAADKVKSSSNETDATPKAESKAAQSGDVLAPEATSSPAGEAQSDAATTAVDTAPAVSSTTQTSEPAPSPAAASSSAVLPSATSSSAVLPQATQPSHAIPTKKPLQSNAKPEQSSSASPSHSVKVLSKAKTKTNRVAQIRHRASVKKVAKLHKSLAPKPKTVAIKHKHHLVATNEHA